MPKPQKIFVIPCSGIGKAVGSVTRKAAYEVVENMRPDTSDTTCLALLTVGDQATQEKFRRTQSIAIDGCPSKCATKNITANEGEVVLSYTLTEELGNNRGLKPSGIIALNEDGITFSHIIAKKVAEDIDRLMNI